MGGEDDRMTESSMTRSRVWRLVLILCSVLSLLAGPSLRFSICTHTGWMFRR